MSAKRFIPDKRRAPREKHDSVLDLYDEDGKHVSGVALMTDVSETGASFRSTLKFTKGVQIRARLRILGQKPLVITGRVVRIKEFTNHTLYGVAFDSPLASSDLRRA